MPDMLLLCACPLDHSNLQRITCLLLPGQLLALRSMVCLGREEVLKGCPSQQQQIKPNQYSHIFKLTLVLQCHMSQNMKSSATAYCKCAVLLSFQNVTGRPSRRMLMHAVLLPPTPLTGEAEASSLLQVQQGWPTGSSLAATAANDNLGPITGKTHRRLVGDILETYRQHSVRAIVHATRYAWMYNLSVRPACYTGTPLH